MIKVYNINIKANFKWIVRAKNNEMQNNKNIVVANITGTSPEANDLSFLVGCKRSLSRSIISLSIYVAEAQSPIDKKATKSEYMLEKL